METQQSASTQVILHLNRNKNSAAKKDSCEFKVRRGFIKEVCIDKVHELEVYKCPNSDIYYFPNRTLIGPDTPPEAIYFDQVCGNDPRFYQACGAGQEREVISNNEDALCGYFVCQVEINQQSLSVLSKPLRRMGWFCNGRQDCTNTDLDETLGCGEEYENVADENVEIVNSENISCHHGDSNAMCVKGTDKCSVHKHKMCDVTFDCDDTWDETGNHCKHMTRRTTCRRTGTETVLLFPLSWVLDGEMDCEDGVDEDVSRWRRCGDGVMRRYVEKESKCEDVMICPGEVQGFVRLEDVCGDKNACGGDLEFCRVTKQNTIKIIQTSKSVNRKLTDGDPISLSYCIKGMERLQELSAPCENEKLIFPPHHTYGVQAETKILLPTGNTNCNGLFGEQYLYQSCLNRCPDTPCPLQTPPRYEHCPNQFPERVGTIADNRYLTFFVRSRGGKFRNDFFVCQDGRRCIEYSRVCDLIEDCDDGSDEKICTNSFKCTSGETHSYLPVSSKCDGRLDCADLSDECNEQCSRNLISNVHLRNFSWIFGILALGANSFVIIKLFMTLRKCRTADGFINKTLVTLMTLGGFLIGIYLTLISIADSIYFKNTYCLHQIQWLTSYGCTSLGVTSVFASQISLFAMLGLSILARGSKLCRTSRIAGEVTRGTITLTMLIVFLITFSSLFLAVFPLLDGFQDYFVVSMNYSQNLKLFVGFPDKSHHLDVIQAYYGRVRKLHSQLSWRNINNLIHGMFTHDANDIEDKMGKTEVPFYSSSSLCLSKYKVEESDPSFNFVWTVIGVNVVCISIITTICFITICSGALFCGKRGKKSTVTGNGKVLNSRTQKQHQKIAIMIGTGITFWVTFLLLCAAPSIKMVDMNKHQSTFFIVFQGMIAMSNPMIYSGLVSYAIMVITDKGRMLRMKLRDVMPSALKRSTPMIFSPLTASPEIELESVSVESESESGLQINTLSMPDSVFEINSECKDERHLKRSKEFNESIFELENEVIDSAVNKEAVDSFEAVIKSFDESTDSNNIESDDYFENNIISSKSS